MKWTCIAMVALCLCAFTSDAQRIKYYTTKEFQYKVHYTSAGGKCTVDSIIILKPATEQRIQKLVPPTNKSYCGVKYEPIVIDDYNFDNLADIGIVQLLPSVSGSVACYWLYDAGTNNYIRNLELEKINNLQVDKKNKSIVSEWKENETHFGISTYTWEDGELTKTREVEQEYMGDIENETAYILETTKKLVKGKMKTVGTKKKKWEEGP